MNNNNNINNLIANLNKKPSGDEHIGTNGSGNEKTVYL
jgi:hypothetical protein